MPWNSTPHIHELPPCPRFCHIMCLSLSFGLPELLVLLECFLLDCFLLIAKFHVEIDFDTATRAFSFLHFFFFNLHATSSQHTRDFFIVGYWLTYTATVRLSSSYGANTPHGTADVPSLAFAAKFCGLLLGQCWDQDYFNTLTLLELEIHCWYLLKKLPFARFFIGSIPSRYWQNLTFCSILWSLPKSERSNFMVMLAGKG